MMALFLIATPGPPLLGNAETARYHKRQHRKLLVTIRGNTENCSTRQLTELIQPDLDRGRSRPQKRGSWVWSNSMPEEHSRTWSAEEPQEGSIESVQTGGARQNRRSAAERRGREEHIAP